MKHRQTSILNNPWIIIHRLIFIGHGIRHYNSLVTVLPDKNRQAVFIANVVLKPWEVWKMKVNLIQGKFVGSLVILLATFTLSVAEQDKDKKVLEVTKNTPFLDVSQSQIGYRSTLLFYTFKEQSTVLRLEIDNWDKSFPMTGTLYVFAANTSEKEIKKWLNNQYSDGLFPEVPQPVSTLKFPDMICKVTSSKYIDRAKAGLGEYDNYTVNFEVKDHDFKDFRLKGFTGETKVHIPAK